MCDSEQSPDCDDTFFLNFLVWHFVWKEGILYINFLIKDILVSTYKLLAFALDDIIW